MESNFLQVTRLKTQRDQYMASLTAALEKQCVLHSIEKINWPDFSYKPSVKFRIGHLGDRICLKYYVTEQSVRALETKINGDVYKDSCVEFFVSFDGEHYYNFEFSCIGTIHLAYGSGRHGRQRLPEEIVRLIQVEPSLGTKPFELKTGETSWELTVIIPVESLMFNPGMDLSGRDATANFYKCGDELPVPHYVTWNPVKTENPDYHRPEHFGKIKFD